MRPRLVNNTATWLRLLGSSHGLLSTGAFLVRVLIWYLLVYRRAWNIRIICNFLTILKIHFV